ncbi:MAG: DUF975 family protein [Candidatus Cloacimonas sp.]|jgi:uncharacterized membrane protein|nr:DUF975 family protein [Candidatus Cloacimonas sp.]
MRKLNISEVLMLQNYEIRARAWSAMSGKWGNCAIIVLVYYILMMGLSFIPIIGSVGTILVSGPFSLGLAIIFLRLVRSESIDIGMLFKGFEDFMRSFVAGLLVAIYTLLWTLLLIVPGIIASLSYSMTFFILSDNPNIGPDEAIGKSKEMMRGHKMELLLLTLSFFGWFLLGLVTVGIGFLWIGSYYSAAMAVFYQEIRGENAIEEAPYVPFEQNA